MILGFMEALARAPSIRVVVCKSELGAAFMASGYAEGSDKPGVILTVGGPGATNTFTGLCCATAQGSPVVLVSGEVPSHVMGRRAAQDGSALALDVTAMSRPATCVSASVGSVHDACTALDEAFRRAMHERAAAHVSVPLDIQRAAVDGTSICRPRAARSDVATVGLAGVPRAAALVRAEGAKIALLVGRGGTEAGAEIQALAELLGAPVATTCGGKGIFPERHALSLGVFSFGGGPLGRAALTGGLDVLIAIGTGLGEFASANYSDALIPNQALIHVDVDPSVFGRNYDCVPVCGDAKEVCRALIAELAGSRARPLPGWLIDLKARHARVAEPEMLTASSVPIRPERVMHELEQALPSDAFVVADIGTSCLFVAHCLRLSPPQRSFIPMAWSCMGHPLGASLGIRLGSGRPTLCVAGDAAFLSAGLELHTAVEQKVSEFVWLIISNGGHALVRLGTTAILGENHGVEDGKFAHSPRISAIAAALGAASVTVEQPNELQDALGYAFSCGRPCVVDVRVDPKAMPPMADRIQGLGTKV